MSEKATLTSYVYKLVASLYGAGARDVVVSPGSRSTPLAYAFASSKEYNMYRQVDERSAAFLALGIAKASNRPVVLVCTSGTAAANYFPAIVEASYARVPLIVLTADRPHELREVGAPQAIDQIHLYGEHVKWSVDFPLPDTSKGTLPFIERHIARAVSIATTAPAGPVQVNVPFREPLLIDFQEELPVGTFVESYAAELRPSKNAFRALEGAINDVKKGFLIFGEMNQGTDLEAVWNFIRQLKWPVLVESLSHLRTNIPADCMGLIIDQYDAILKNESFKAAMAPDTVIRFGAQPVSKPLTLFLTKAKLVNYIVVDEDSMFRDSLAIATHHVHANVSDWLEDVAVEAAGDATYVADWMTANDIATKHIECYLAEETDEGAMAATLFANLPEASDLFASSSMPIRDVDTFFNKTSKDIKIFANRGTNGIDGVVSTAFGLQLARQRETYLLIGDLSFLHDVNGLIATRYQACNMTIVVMNNDGGGIFSYLAQAKEEAHYEELFGTPSGLEFKDIAQMYGAEYKAVEAKEDFTKVLQAPKEKPLRLIEVFTDRQKNVATHRKLWSAIGEELDAKWQV
ncbi:2-succinyl-5-enolpyruvyl-6-hydroxy-3-cyclohexene-1-carboxylic-acid synthase [Viridibacillus sp. YIM B01967]|uniref:2-succinyl-5-enolpyruvyl-6-hydroxy-3-cyclohexene-1-carboxylate synthase n=1 Tax=Viridibacillus soli TaxID=2798301 RepID=A0ABS1H9M0_9BACL|nr:2-succinyl-5-enolpyruvyl-6-hydroxy-3-cyclohexene-1-carboxylic-acid synthase [Viridibacillus soli]MBK3496114.1 2-succinyl-5-enolpyruvyl-6-hydroxy-3-cyclohexene-1-carboxylic-acid synthase [Viridibacillus soli]